MARVVIDTVQRDIQGAGYVLTVTMTLYGSDVPGGSDVTVITVPLPGTMSKLTRRAAIKDAIIAEAQRLNLTVTEVTSISADLLGGL